MLGTRWQSFGGVRSDLNRLQTEMERVFGSISKDSPRRSSRGLFPAVNIWEEDDALYVQAELPGIDMDDLEAGMVLTEDLRMSDGRLLLVKDTRLTAATIASIRNLGRNQLIKAYVKT